MRGRLFSHATLLLVLMSIAAVLMGCMSRREQPASVNQDTASQQADSVRQAEILREDTLQTAEQDSYGQAFRDSVLKVQQDSLDSTATDTAAGDTLILSDSLAADSSLVDSLSTDSPAQEEEEEDLDTTISYTAEDIRFNVENRITILAGRAKVTYKKTTLEANEIQVDWDNDLMIATEGYDTLWTDSTQTEIDSITTIGVPAFTDKGQVMTGSMMKVNMENKQGYVVKGKTQDQIGYYGGKEIQKVSDDAFYVAAGGFTTCELEDPHYRFTSSRMKMVRGDKVVGEPIVLRFGDVPVFALPFGVFSIQSGRRSGILIPVYGDSRRDGRNLRNFGYYYAGSEYWDAKMTMDFYEKAGTFFQYNVNYKKRYVLDGGVSGSLSNKDPDRGSYDIAVRHNQDIDPTLKIRVDGKYVSSGNHYSNNSQNVNQILDQKVNSNATVTKNWTNGVGMTVNLRHRQNLATGTNSQSLPNTSLRIPTITLFPGEDDRSRRDPNLIYSPPAPRKEEEEDDEDEDDPWYRNITLNYGADLKNTRKEELETRYYDNGQSYETLHEEYSSGIQHSASLNAPLKVLKYITVNPNARATMDWLNERRKYSMGPSGAVRNEQERGFFTRTTFSAGVNTSTKLYGYFNLNRWTVKTIRHVVTPSVNFSYSPDFSVPNWGYYTELFDSLGNGTRYDKFARSAYGGTSRGKSMRFGFSLQNLFQMKRVVLNQDGEEEEKKKDLFNLNFNTSWNMAADSMKWSNLSTSFRVVENLAQFGPLQRLTFDMSATHSLYQYGQWEDANDRTRRGAINKFYWERPNPGLNLLRMTNFTANAGYTLTGGSPFAWQPGGGQREDEEAEDDSLEVFDEEGPPPVEEEERFNDPSWRGGGRGGGGGRGPWQIGGSFRYNLSMNDPMNPSERLTFQANMTLNLTETWSFTYNTSMDLIERTISIGSINVTKDLHCWQGTFNWTPTGIGQGIYLVIGLKASMLRDVKFEHGDRTTGRSYGGIGGGFR